MKQKMVALTSDDDSDSDNESQGEQSEHSNSDSERLNAQFDHDSTIHGYSMGMSKFDTLIKNLKLPKFIEFNNC